MWVLGLSTGRKRMSIGKYTWPCKSDPLSSGVISSNEYLVLLQLATREDVDTYGRSSPFHTTSMHEVWVGLPRNSDSWRIELSCLFRSRSSLHWRTWWSHLPCSRNHTDNETGEEWMVQEHTITTWVRDGDQAMMKYGYEPGYGLGVKRDKWANSTEATKGYYQLGVSTYKLEEFIIVTLWRRFLCQSMFWARNWTVICGNDQGMLR